MHFEVELKNDLIGLGVVQEESGCEDSCFCSMWSAVAQQTWCQKFSHSLHDGAAGRFGSKATKGAANCDESKATVLPKCHQRGTKEEKTDCHRELALEDDVSQGCEGPQQCRASTLCRGSSHVL